MQRIFENDDASAYLVVGPRFSIHQSVDYVEPLLEERPEIVVYGKVCRQRRNVGFFSDTSRGYAYSNRTMVAQPLGYELTLIMGIVNRLLSAEFNGILVNQYMDGNDYIGAHSDDEAGLDPVGVASISYGAERLLRIRDKKTKQIVFETRMENGRLYLMGGDFQKQYTHEIPVEAKIKEPRISFTFRKHI
jgi:alkylated DNA repair dioxygenase AlkB